MEQNKKAPRCPSPDITEAPLRRPQKLKERTIKQEPTSPRTAEPLESEPMNSDKTSNDVVPMEVEQNEEVEVKKEPVPETTVKRGRRGRPPKRGGTVKPSPTGRGRGRPRKSPVTPAVLSITPTDANASEPNSSSETQGEVIVQIEKDVQALQLASDVNKELAANEEEQTESYSESHSIFSVKSEKSYDPAFIPGLDLLDDGKDKSQSTSHVQISSLTKSLDALIGGFTDDDYIPDDPDGTRIRRSSRIKSLEEKGSRSRRREVVFSSGESSNSKGISSIVDDDSSSNCSSSFFGGLSPSDSLSSGFSSGSAVGKDPTEQDDFYMKPLKVKSRWRYSSDLESQKNSEEFHSSERDKDKDEIVTETVPPEPEFVPSKSFTKKPGHMLFDKNDVELLEKLKKFQGIEDNVFRKERKVSKESKAMECDCILTAEDIERGEKGCEEDCLNRLLMVECGPRCPTGDKCTNKRFQRKQYATLEVFKTEKKGHGLRTLQSIPEGGFVIEYVGEVLDPVQFESRTQEYAKSKQEHFYFMSLKSDSIIDATMKGNCSRFINHSCEPNCETQKWTVNGELRIGFFTLEDLKAGDEIVFDYQFQRYGKQAQKCYCMTPSCRGWIDVDVDEDNEADDESRLQEEDDDKEAEPTITVEKKPKRGRPRKPRQDITQMLEDIGLEDDLMQLERSGLKNKTHTLALSRLMVRAEKWDDRERLLHILIQGDPACRRLFLDYRGLKLLYNWMVHLPLPSADTCEQSIKTEDYHLLFLRALGSLNIPNKTMLLDSKVLALMETWSSVPYRVPIATQAIVTPSESSTQTTNSDAATPNSSEMASDVKAETPENNEVSSSVTLASEIKEEHLSDSSMSDSVKTVESEPTEHYVEWSFVELAKELLNTWADLKEVFRIPKKERVEQMKEHEREADKGSSLSVPNSSIAQSSYTYERDGRSSKYRTNRERRITVHDSSHRHHPSFKLNFRSSMSKEEIRSKFAEKVAREEEEMRQRVFQADLLSFHSRRCGVVGVDPCTTPIVDKSGHYYLDPNTIQWVIIDVNDPNLPFGIRKLVDAGTGNAPEILNASNTQEAELSFPPWPEGLPPPPPLPPAVFPDGWKMAVDEEGRCYYYHIRTKKTQWHPPTPEDCVEDNLESTESSDSEELEEMSVSGEEEPILDAPKPEPIQTFRTKLIERAERRKKSGLVQERIISPRSEDDKSNISKAVIRARKLEVLEEKKQRAAEALLKEQQKKEEISAPASSKSGTTSSKSVDVTCKTKKAEVDPSAVDSSEDPRMSKVDSKDDNVGDVSGSSPIETELDISLASMTEEGFDETKIEKPVMIPGLGNDPRDTLTVTAAPPAPVTPAKKERSQKPDRKHKSHNAYKKLSSDKSKEAFRNQIANVVVTYLNPYRKPECKGGRITSTEDFKHLARKMTHAILLKELKQSREGKVLEVTDSVKHKTKEYIKKYMARYSSSNYAPSPDDSHDKS